MVAFTLLSQNCVGGGRDLQIIVLLENERSLGDVDI